ncbi:hypothetical protein G4Y79_06065 [Phototrophicus methaneseepsis]|uniref:GH16 domain-containing protein n=1 Tax=Phototrophicus methaneseepsis TaxID=2710758 RepID=A0A7S8EBM0_9CHLR|nr:hypothetical protein [Phototrophicus methaneseepsis]QPC83942.1 hypothetical protein G4Y79_06065 [Phototrophicus methaneseepsis]
MTLSSYWGLHPTEIGHASINQQDNRVHLVIEPGAQGYSDAQLTDYDPQERDFTLRPPLTMTITAYSETSLQVGTAGFGFWNYPFQPGQRRFRLPQALWFFFGAPPNNMALALDVPGDGFKAATFNAQRWQFLAMLPVALPGFLLMRIPALYRSLWPIGQQALGVSEAALSRDLLAAPHTYTLDWLPDEATFRVDGQVVLHTKQVPHTSLGFIVWVDNQYAIVTPQGQFNFGVTPVEASQSLTIEHINLEKR